jgi:tetratricopeptide (TPR) repeat protein
MFSLFNRQHISRFLLLLTFCGTSFFGTYTLAADKNSKPDIDQRYQSAISQAFTDQANNPAFTLTQSDLNSLLTAINDAQKNQKPEKVLGLINNNISLIQSNYKSKHIPELVRIALKTYSLGTALKIRSAIDTQASRSIIANCEYEIANYYANQNLWDEALAHLKTIDIGNELTRENVDNAYIIWGAALQHSKKHRQALEYYQRIKPDSPRYAFAQLNVALVYIRQDWWTDAQIAIQSAIQISSQNNIEFANRLYTTLGFSQLQQGFYRKARESFRNVKVKSEYADQALLGIGMSALNQEDYLGALNAFDQLKKHTKKTAPIEQAYLLSAVALSKLKQNASAANAYTEAENYYGMALNGLSDIAKQIDSPTSNNWQSIALDLNQQNVAETSDSLALTKQLEVLNNLLAYPISEASKSNLSNVYSQLFQIYKTDAKDRLDKKTTEFNSYLNQSRFGKTKLYDTP